MEQVVQLDLDGADLPVRDVLQDVLILGLAVRASEVGEEVLGERSFRGVVDGLVRYCLFSRLCL